MKPTEHAYSLFDEDTTKAQLEGGGIVVRRLHAQENAEGLTTPSGCESILILMGSSALVGGQRIAGTRQLAILAPDASIELERETLAWLISAVMDAAPFTRLAALPEIFDMDGLQPPADNPRLKMLQTDAMSINWVRYQGPRDRRQLSPHSHATFAQGSLALEGRFIHHLRTPWGKDADGWREDVHLAADSPSLTTIPAGVEHTTEGVDGDWHLLIDLFEPPRRDYIERGWILNAMDYQPTSK
ncbi:hypothetical protein [Chelativorans sp. AA-79]|uniref:hypothetical protein n=1 Tax=Chelativorans sp. AA-79 TaxID=3028735 RepID=UPI0023F6FD88|nr:hypothetical protein [Chelativorans sp. AA-79]WEX07980.1 hypothetical protein PVE73_18045 [Chelativorans sp. AA-79]